MSSISDESRGTHRVTRISRTATSIAVAKVNARGEWIASWGSLGNGPGQFDTPHGIAVSPTDEIFVADRGNRRIQVLDTTGKYLREFTIDVPVDTSRGKIVYGVEAPNGKTGSLAPGAPDALCITPGPNPVLFVGDLIEADLQVYRARLACMASWSNSASSVGSTPSRVRRRTRSGSRS